jgi:hypothetical protein
LYPYATAQPLRLYKRGQPDEHYAFYTYYSKTALIANANPPSSSASSSLFESTPSPQPEARPLDIANATTTVSVTPKAQAFCEFARTRFRVQIWTQRPFVTSVPVAAGMDSSDGLTMRTKAADSSANEMLAPGSLPYSVTISLDRESGPDGDEGKGVFCWALGSSGTVVGEGKRVSEKDVSAEVEVERRDEGGKGGCGCRWES